MCFSDVDPAGDYRHPGVICGDATTQERADLAAQSLRLPADDETEHVFRQRRKRHQCPEWKRRPLPEKQCQLLS